MTQSDFELELDLDFKTIHCTSEEIANALAGLLHEMRTAAPFITPEERETLRLIMSHPGGTLTVGDLFPDFDRDADPEPLTALRRLRTAQFIRPAEHDRWEVGERIEIKPFARIIWDKLGEAAIFGDAPADDAHAEDGHAEPAEHAEPVEEVDIDLALPEVNESGSGPAARKGKKDDKGWDEADVLDFLNDDSTPTLKRNGR